MYTPRDKRAEHVIRNDRPYDGEAAVVYLRSSSITRMGGADRQLFYGIKAGCVGDCAKAKRLQKFVHNDLDYGVDPRGWDNQNKSEAILDGIAYYRLRSKGSSIFNTVVSEETTWGAEAGNANVKSWLQTVIEQQLYKNIYARGLLNGSLVAYDTHLDGRLFADNNHTVDSVPLVASAGFELVWRNEDLELSYGYVYQTDQFEGQEGRHLFGSLNIGWFW